MSLSNPSPSNPFPFGSVDIKGSDAFFFPAGLPGFANHRRFVLIHNPANPIAFLQSVEFPAIRFTLLPVSTIDCAYRLAVESHDLAVLFPDRLPATLSEVKAYFVVSAKDDSEPRINMLAPIVVRPANGLGVQAVRSDSTYSHCALLVEVLNPRGPHGLAAC